MGMDERIRAVFGYIIPLALALYGLFGLITQKLYFSHHHEGYTVEGTGALLTGMALIFLATALHLGTLQKTVFSLSQQQSRWIVKALLVLALVLGSVGGSWDALKLAVKGVTAVLAK